MKRKIVTTADGSKTIHIEEWNEQYHSIHGAINEANHVFIKHGLLFFCDNSASVSNKLNILEIGFGTGLNAFLTLLKSKELDVNINYTGVEAYPVSNSEVAALNYPELISAMHSSEFKLMHASDWESEIQISSNFSLEKQKKFFDDINAISKFDIIYFDAFGSRVQPELWEEPIFNIMFSALTPGGVLTTYSAKGSARRAMQSVGFEVERLDGPPNKRHMLRATKP